MTVTCMGWRHVLVLAHRYTTAELCEWADHAREAGSTRLEDGLLAAIGLHAKRAGGWGELIEQGMLATHRKEEP